MQPPGKQERPMQINAFPSQGAREPQPAFSKLPSKHPEHYRGHCTERVPQATYLGLAMIVCCLRLSPGRP